MIKTSISRTCILFSCLALVLVGCSAQDIRRNQTANTIPINLPLQTQAHLRDFDLVIKTVRDLYLESKSVGTDWQSNVTTYRQQIAAGEMTDEQFLATFDELLSTLKDTDLSLHRPTLSTAVDSTMPTTSTGSLAGIGIEAGYPQPGKNRILILAVYPDTPAERAGLKPHDAIVSLDGVTATYADRDASLARIRGRNGSSLTLTIQTPGKGPRDVTLIRQPITVSDLTSYKRLPNSNIGFINPDPTSAEIMPLIVSEALRDMTRGAPLDGLILDLRTSQSMDFPIESMLTLFANGEVGARYTRAGRTKLDISGKNIAGSQELPLIVLVSDQTVGTTESFAGILKELGRAKIVGTATPGRNAEIAGAGMPNSGGRVLIPAAEYRGIQGQSWYRVGIKPDVATDQLWEEMTDETDTQINLALQAISRR